MLKKFISYYKPVRLIFITDMVCAFAVAVCDLFYPMITRNIINIYVPNQQFELMIKWLLILGGIYVLKFGLNYYITYYGHIMGVKMQANMRKDIFEHLQDLPFVFFDENKTGSLSSRIINDLMDISELAHHGPEDLFISTVMLIGSFIMLSRINLPLSLIVFSIVPLLILVAMKLRIKMEDAFMETRETIGEVNATIENSISGIRVSKAFSNKEIEIEKFNKNNSKFQEARRKAYKVMAEFHVGSSFIIDILNIVVLSAGAIFFFKGRINFGDFAAFLLYIGNFLNPIRKLVNFVEQYQSGISGFKRFAEIMEKDVEKDDPSAEDIFEVRGDISFNKVTFAYDDNKEILKDISFDIEAGETVALVGPSGGGKTTLCHLIPRFYEIEEGSISIDNIDIRKFTRRSLRKNIGIVQQDVFLFTGTIYENIQCGKFDASREEVYEAAKKANIMISLPVLKYLFPSYMKLILFLPRNTPLLQPTNYSSLRNEAGV
jgi:ATP-binding cassette subfamily B protein